MLGDAPLSEACIAGSSPNGHVSGSEWHMEDWAEPKWLYLARGAPDGGAMIRGAQPAAAVSAGSYVVLVLFSQGQQDMHGSGLVNE